MLKKNAMIWTKGIFKIYLVIGMDHSWAKKLISWLTFAYVHNKSSVT